MDHETFVLDGIMVVGGTKDAIELVNGKYDSIWRSGRDKSRFGDVAFVDVGVGNEVRLSEHIIIGVTVHGLDGRGVGLLIHDFMMQLQCIIGLKLSSLTSRFPKSRNGPRIWQGSRGVRPSPSEIASSGAFTGSTS